MKAWSVKRDLFRVFLATANAFASGVRPDMEVTSHDK
jgi:hypothetical protein